MDELEFEKACRGPLYPVPNEYPWGDTLLTAMTGFVGLDGSGTETAKPTNANVNVGLAALVARCAWAFLPRQRRADMTRARVIMGS